MPLSLKLGSDTGGMESGARGPHGGRWAQLEGPRADGGIPGPRAALLWPTQGPFPSLRTKATSSVLVPPATPVAAEGQRGGLGLAVTREDGDRLGLGTGSSLALTPFAWTRLATGCSAFQEGSSPWTPPPQAPSPLRSASKLRAP